MAQVKTSDLSGAALDWAVAKCEGTLGFYVQPNDKRGTTKWEVIPSTRRYSTNWAQGGPIIDANDIAISPLPDGLWRAYIPDGVQWVPRGELGMEVFKWTHKGEGYHPLIAAMRCFVASKLGDVVEIPEELC